MPKPEALSLNDAEIVMTAEALAMFAALVRDHAENPEFIRAAGSLAERFREAAIAVQADMDTPPASPLAN